jgi:hypothetical protein
MTNQNALEVVMQCKYCRAEETPVLILNPPPADDIPVLCFECQRMPMIADAHEHESYRDSIKALIVAASLDAPLAIALSNATAMLARVKSPFSISIRAER